MHRRIKALLTVVLVLMLVASVVGCRRDEFTGTFSSGRSGSVKYQFLSAGKYRVLATGFQIGENVVSSGRFEILQDGQTVMMYDSHGGSLQAALSQDRNVLTCTGFQYHRQ